MDTQGAKLRKTLRDTGVSVERDGDNINLIMPGNITFVTNGHDLNANFYEVLDSVVLVVQEFEKTLIVVAGHTDSTGSSSYNQALSERRQCHRGRPQPQSPRRTVAAADSRGKLLGVFFSQQQPANPRRGKE